MNSVVQVEVLLLLQRSEPAGLTAGAVGRELRIDGGWAGTELAYLAARGLLSVEQGPEPAYHFHPANEALRDAVTGLAKAYAERRVSVISRIFSKPSDKIRTFADAFRIWKEK